MNLKRQKISTVAALLVMFAIAQVYIGASFAKPTNEAAPSVEPQTLMGVLTTRDGQPILVNGVSTPSGATIPTGAVIETPENVGATINIGGLGGVCIAPNSKLVLDFSQTGNTGNVNTNLTQGCVILTTSRNTGGMIKTPQGDTVVIQQSKGGSIDVCSPPGQASIINKGAAANAGAGASGLGCAPPAGAAAIPTYGNWDVAAVLIAGGTGITLCVLFCNPSPSSP